MLELSRKVGRSIYIGRGVTVTVLSMEDGEVVLGIDAPQRIAVSRDDFSFDEHMKFQVEREEDFGRGAL